MPNNNNSNDGWTTVVIESSLSDACDCIGNSKRHVKQNVLKCTFFSLQRGRKPEIVQVIAPYQATSAEQLDLQKGALIMIRKKTDSGWWEGELQVRQCIIYLIPQVKHEFL